MDKIEIKPCPFCGGEAEILSPQSSRFSHVRCSDCNNRGAKFVNEDLAIKHWNLRNEKRN